MDDKRYELKRKLDEIEDIQGNHTELITLYVPPDKNIKDAYDQLKDEYRQASNIKTKSTRKNVQSALDVLMGKLKHFKNPPENGMIMMAGEVPTRGDKTDMMSLIIEPPEKLNSYRYHCDSNFLVEPLREIVENKKKIGLLVLDRREATVGLLIGNNIEALRHHTSGVPGKTKAGGQSQARFERLRDIAANEFYKRVGESANEIFENEEDLVGVLVGGPSPTKEEFLKMDLLHHEIDVIDKYDVSYTDEYGLRELVDVASETLERIETMEERRAAKEFLKKLVEDENMVTYGEKEVRKAIRIGAVEKLVISEELRKYRVNITCSECNYSKDITVKGEGPKEIKNRYENCPECNGELDIEVEDVVTELAEMTDNMGGEVVFVSTDFEEGQQLYNAFGGVAAILRFSPS
ncbi:peptide chain release factor aRF-1 [Methanonatronarchaeum sp. AMET-Sl]|uniref:peptide chain release factor aRF-1 n=1 Tax=Methanonatronarchaeum sp. AMET-Sl TaxID=3037654 RepID=UPI00244E07E9|nr:peptide chain release factor aRF-1 [Methanonatronarchaeum sp. AMET-Sl]WGI18160.1 peptide chain release factor aRF-1 [Methanonatronarchaeum sp. AMET-Sl]